MPAASIAAEPPKAAGSVPGLPRTQRLIAEKKPIRVVAYGDSIRRRAFNGDPQRACRG